MRSDVLRWLSPLVAVAASFMAGFVSHPIVMTDVHSGERHQSELEAMRYEALTFFYDTMTALFDGTYNADKDFVSPEALDTFKEFHLKLDRRCWLISVYPDNDLFRGDAMFPSGDIFEVAIKVTPQGWQLDTFHHLGTTLFYHDLVNPVQLASNRDQKTGSR
jgi:hypothetical protein